MAQKLLTKSYLCAKQVAYRCSPSGGGRKVRTPQSSIAGNARRSPWRIGQVQQKRMCTGKAVVKSGKLYTVQRQVNLRLRAARSSRRVGG